MPSDGDHKIEPEDASATPVAPATPAAPTAPDETPGADAMRGSPPLDANDVVPVPVAMEPSEIDERARVVQALRERADRERADRERGGRDDDEGMR